MKTLAVSSLLFIFILGFNACKKDDPLTEPVGNIPGPPGSPTAGITNLDSFLVAQSHLLQNFTWYKNDPVIRESSNASAHNKYFRVRFNAIANAALSAQGKLPAGGAFPQGSLVVKELYDTPTGPVKLLAILLKDSANSYAVNGWLWAELKPDGGNYISATAKGAQCVSCHSANSRDYTRIFDLF
jgi:hypothetical protein